MKHTKRVYRQGARRRKSADTRLRIAQAAMELHGEVGPRRTTISAIAERAGVERLTVYRHFPDNEALFSGCSERFRDLNPPPGPDLWRPIATPEERARKLLGELYAYFDRVATMLDRLYRDSGEIPALDRQLEQFDEYLDALAVDLAATQGGRSMRLKATARLLTRFRTWSELGRGELGHRARVDLALTLLQAAGEKKIRNAGSRKATTKNPARPRATTPSPRRKSVTR